MDENICSVDGESVCHEGGRCSFCYIGTGGVIGKPPTPLGSTEAGLCCADCGVTGDYCGYHQLGSQKISLCVTCAEREVTVWHITLADEDSGGIVHQTINKAIETMTVIIREMENQDDDSDSYSIHKQKMSRLEVVTMPEFQGF